MRDCLTTTIIYTMTTTSIQTPTSSTSLIPIPTPITTTTTSTNTIIYTTNDISITSVTQWCFGKILRAQMEK